MPVRKMLGIRIQYIIHNCALIMYQEPEMPNVYHKITGWITGMVGNWNKRRYPTIGK